MINADSDPDIHRWLALDSVEAAARFCKGMTEEFYLRVADSVGARGEEITYFLERFYGTGPLTPRITWELFPYAKEVFLVRDFRDVFCSMRAFSRKTGMTMFGREAWPDDEDYVRSKMASDVFGVLHMWRERHEKGYLLRYEDLIVNPLEALAGVLSYLGVRGGAGTVQKMCESAEAAHLRKQEWHKTSRSAAASIGRWRHELDHHLVSAFEQELGEALTEFGYPLNNGA
jgi:hypothetical protein